LRRNLSLVVLLLLLMLSTIGQAAASNLIRNGNFETVNLTSWDFDPQCNSRHVGELTAQSDIVHSGQYALKISQSREGGFISCSIGQSLLGISTNPMLPYQPVGPYVTRDDMFQFSVYLVDENSTISIVVGFVKSDFAESGIVTLEEHTTVYMISAAHINHTEPAANLCGLPHQDCWNTTHTITFLSQNQLTGGWITFQRPLLEDAESAKDGKGQPLWNTTILRYADTGLTALINVAPLSYNTTQYLDDFAISTRGPPNQQTTATTTPNSQATQTRTQNVPTSYFSVTSIAIIVAAVVSLCLFAWLFITIHRDRARQQRRQAARQVRTVS
jgi:hypothetical protein